MFVRVSCIREKVLPWATLYEVTPDGIVPRMVDFDIDGEIYWDSVAAAKDPREMLGRNSLVEGPFPDEAKWRHSDTQVYERMTKEAFELWFERAQNLGRRRTHAEMSRLIMERVEANRKK